MTRDRSTQLAFAGIVLLGGLNVIAVKFGNVELPPFWAAALRMLIAAVVLFAIVAIRRIPLPRGRALLGSVLYGTLSFGVFMGAMYWGLVTTPAGLAMIILAIVPLLTLFLAVAHGLERFRLASLIGSLVALVGIALIALERLDPAQAMPIAGVAVIAVASLANAETNVLVKLLPRSHPLTNNATAIGVGALILFGVSAAFGEPWTIPQQPQALLSLAYLAVVGSVGLFTLFLLVIERWSASATSYALLPMPIVSVVAAALLLGEPITPMLVVGGALVLGGVYLGAFVSSHRLWLPGWPRALAAHRAATEPPAPAVPNCP